MSEAIDIIDDREHNRFVYREGGVEAELVYRRDGDRLILVHTGVPEALGGRGIGARLVRAAIGRASVSGEVLVPWCPYARRWIEEHPEEVEGVTVDWSPPPR